MAEVKLNDISSNSDSSRRNEEQKQRSEDEIKHVPLKKHSLVGKALGNIGVNTDVGGAGKSIWEDVIVPAFLDVCRDAMYAAADYIFGGGVRRNNRGRQAGKSGYTNYSAQSTKKSSKKQPNTASYYLEWEDRQTAQDRLDQMYDVLSVAKCVSIQDYLTIDGKTTSNYMLGDWGWDDLSRAMVRKNANGMYYIDLPRPIALEDKG